MKIEEMVHSFMERIREHEHVKVLFAEDPFSIAFGVGNDVYSIILSKDALYMEQGADAPTIRITGTAKEMNDLFYGKMKLQGLLRMSKLQFNGSYRSLLLVEAILYLVRPYVENTQIA